MSTFSLRPGSSSLARLATPEEPDWSAVLTFLQAGGHPVRGSVIHPFVWQQFDFEALLL